jgi:hypothetical protein
MSCFDSCDTSKSTPYQSANPSSWGKRGQELHKDIEAFATEFKGNWVDDSSPEDIIVAQAKESVHCLHCTGWVELVRKDDRADFYFSEHLTHAGGPTCYGYSCKLGEVLISCPRCTDVIMAQTVFGMHNNHTDAVQVIVPWHTYQGHSCNGTGMSAHPIGR